MRKLSLSLAILFLISASAFAQYLPRNQRVYVPGAGTNTAAILGFPGATASWDSSGGVLTIYTTGGGGSSIDTNAVVSLISSNQNSAAFTNAVTGISGTGGIGVYGFSLDTSTSKNHSGITNLLISYTGGAVATVFTNSLAPKQLAIQVSLWSPFFNILTNLVNGIYPLSITNMFGPSTGGFALIVPGSSNVIVTSTINFPVIFNNPVTFNSTVTNATVINLSTNIILGTTTNYVATTVYSTQVVYQVTNYQVITNSMTTNTVNTYVDVGGTWDASQSALVKFPGGFYYSNGTWTVGSALCSAIASCGGIGGGTTNRWLVNGAGGLTNDTLNIVNGSNTSVVLTNVAGIPTLTVNATGGGTTNIATILATGPAPGNAAWQALTNVGTFTAVSITETQGTSRVSFTNDAYGAFINLAHVLTDGSTNASTTAASTNWVGAYVAANGGLSTNDFFGLLWPNGNTNWVRWLNFTNDVNALALVQANNSSAAVSNAVTSLGYLTSTTGLTNGGFRILTNSVLAATVSNGGSVNLSMVDSNAVNSIVGSTNATTLAAIALKLNSTYTNNTVTGTSNGVSVLNGVVTNWATLPASGTTYTNLGNQLPGVIVGSGIGTQLTAAAISAAGGLTNGQGGAAGQITNNQTGVTLNGLSVGVPLFHQFLQPGGALNYGSVSNGLIVGTAGTGFALNYDVIQSDYSTPQISWWSVSSLRYTGGVVNFAFSHFLGQAGGSNVLEFYSLTSTNGGVVLTAVPAVNLIISNVMPSVVNAITNMTGTFTPSGWTAGSTLPSYFGFKRAADNTFDTSSATNSLLGITLWQ
ncbi:MAG: hypothetical protein WCS70_09050 [Verrucomicrobiota bacterium]